jgi:uncharacterized protein (TIGR03032 family)
MSTGLPAAAHLDLRVSVSPDFPDVLRALGVTLVVTTYETGRVILLRADGHGLNVHLRAFPCPMGVAVAGGRLALGTEREIWELFDLPALAGGVEPRGRHDALYAPRFATITGDIRVHELAYAGGELWVANTRFSCLCTLDRQHSFVPRWRPPFVSALAPDDRCHLNGLCVVDDRIRYVTVLGATDTPDGWRATRADGGCILEVPSGRIVASGLSMPHSPRVHDGALWVLDSGRGGVATVDPASGAVRSRAQLPGFARGLALAGRYAFVGLSQARESDYFGNLPLDTMPERHCGIWVLDTQTGATVAGLRFEGDVREIFDVQILPHRFPELLEPQSDLVRRTFALPTDAVDHTPRTIPVPQPG